MLKNGVIRDWSPEERPREKLLEKGPKALTTAELLAIILGAGTRRKNAVTIASQLLQTFSSLQKLSSRDISELVKIEGIGVCKAVRLAATFELGVRTEAEPYVASNIIRGPADVAGRFIPRLRSRRTEIFIVLMLNTSNQVIREVEVSTGSLNSSVVHPREVFRTAITENAAAVLALHNHPSGNPKPSREDIAVTKQLVEAGTVVGIPLHDHIIIAGEKYTSFAEEGLL